MDQALRHGYKVFADVKLHDIPTTVERAVESLVASGVSYITVHLSGGAEMLHAAVKGSSDRALILGVAVLTSLTPQDQIHIFGRSGNSLVLDQFARGGDAGLTGFICPPFALEAARERYPRVKTASGRGWILAVPGLRWEPVADDHAVTMTPEDAATLGADILILGRTLARALHAPEALARLHALKSL